MSTRVLHTLYPKTTAVVAVISQAIIAYIESHAIIHLIISVMLSPLFVRKYLTTKKRGDDRNKKCITKLVYHIIGVSPSGKASGFDPDRV